MMELTREEREKIYLEEKARCEARVETVQENMGGVGSNTLALIGSVILIVGLFNPWVAYGAFSASADGNIVQLVLGIGVVITSIVGYSIKRALSGVYALLGLLSLGWMVALYFAISENYLKKPMYGVSAHICEGFFISVLGAFLVLVSAFLPSGARKAKMIAIH